MTEESLLVEVGLPAGTVTIPASWSEPDAPVGDTVILAHGAGTGREHPFLVGLAEALNEQGVRVVRFDFPYRAQGRRMPGPAAHAIATWHAVLAAVRSRVDGPVWAAGRSYGGRMASMAAAEGMDVAGLVYLAYPLHPPGRPEKPRVEHLPAITAPQLFVEGTNDPFIQPLEQFEQAVATCQDARVEWIEGGGHSYEVRGNKRTADVIGASVAPLVSAFLSSAR